MKSTLGTAYLTIFGPRYKRNCRPPLALQRRRVAGGSASIGSRIHKRSKGRFVMHGLTHRRQPVTKLVPPAKVFRQRVFVILRTQTPFPIDDLDGYVGQPFFDVYLPSAETHEPELLGLSLPVHPAESAMQRCRLPFTPMRTAQNFQGSMATIIRLAMREVRQPVAIADQLSGRQH